jgi:hypothetical protein
MVREIKSISVSRELSELASQNKLSWSEAARVGMALLLAELGIQEYDNNLNLYRKMQFFKAELEKISIKVNGTA